MEAPDQSIRGISAWEANRTNHFIYCHHCREMRDMHLEGFAFVPEMGFVNIWHCRTCFGRVEVSRATL